MRVPAARTLAERYAPELVVALHKLDAMGHALKIRFTVQYSFDLLKDVVRDLGRYDARMGPQVDPQFGPINTFEGFWVAGLNPRDEVVTMNLVRFFHWPHGSLFDALTAGQFFERDPARPTGARCHGPEGSITKGMRGRLAHPGGIWVHPDRRGERPDAMRITRILSRLSRIAAVIHGDVDGTFSWVELSRLAQGKPADYGYERIERGWVLHYAGGQPQDLALVTASRAEIMADAFAVTRGELKRPGFAS